MPQWVIRRNARRFPVTPIYEVTVTADARVADWVARVVKNGGTTPSPSTQTAVGNLLNSLSANGLMSYMSVINGIVPDNLTAAMTPVLAGPGFDPWTTGLLGSDLSTSGITGNTGFSTKWANTGVIPAFSSSLNVLSDYGMTAYMSVIASSTPTQVDFGCINTSNSTSDQFLISNTGGTCAVNLTGSAGQIGVTAPGAGYFSVERTATNALALYWANSTHAHSAIGSNSSTAAAGKTIPMYVLAANNQASGTATDFSGNTMSFFAIHHGLSSSQSSTFFSIIQTYRRALGGGFV